MIAPEWIERACVDALRGERRAHGRCAGCGGDAGRCQRPGDRGWEVCDATIALAQAAADEIEHTRAGALLLGGPDGGPGWCAACGTLARLGLETIDGEITPLGRLTREILGVRVRVAEIAAGG